MSDLREYITKEINPNTCTKEVGKRYLKRLEEGAPTRDENPASHFCCYFLPYNLATKQVFLVHHKKSGLWIFPGGHIDKGEHPLEALNREVEEELGVKGKVSDAKPFLFTITLIDRPPHTCREHLDIWFRFEADGSEFHIDPREFHDTKWVNLAEARGCVTDPPNLQALDRMEQLFNDLFRQF